MIISKFNKYVEKHGRLTYIVLGVIICLAFVVFVAPEGAEGGCSGPGRVKSMGRMFGKNISVEEYMSFRNMADLTCYMRYNVLLSQFNEAMLNRETYNRIRTVRAAKKYGFYKKVSDADVAKNIHGNPIFAEDGKFSLELFTSFKDNFLRSFNMKAADFDEMVRQNLAMELLQNEQTKDVTVTEAEVDSELAEYTLSYAEITRDAVRAVEPTQGEIDDFFVKRKAEIVPDKLRSAFLASFKLADYAKNIVVKDDEIINLYNAQKDRLYKGKTLEQAKPTIASELKANKVRAEMRKAAVAFIQTVTKETAGMDAKAAVAKAQELAKTAKAAVSLTPLAVADKSGVSPVVARAISALDKPGQVNHVPASTPAEFTVVMLADIKDGVLPEKLDEATTAKVRDAIIGEKAVAFFNEKVAPYMAAAPGTQMFWQLGAAKQQEIQADTSMDMAARQKAMMELSDFIRDYVAPFYHEEQRSFTVAAFNPADYKAGVILSEADIKKGYEARIDEYGKVEVKLDRITVKFADGDDDKAKAAKKAKADAAFKKLTDGTDFAAVAKEFSEESAVSTGLVDVKTLDEALAKQVDKMAAGQLSPVVAVKDGYSIVRLVEKKGPRSLEDVRAELVKQLTDDAAAKAAADDAGKLRAAVVADILDKERGVKAVAALKSGAAAYGKAKVSDIARTVRVNRLASGAAADSNLMAAVFGATLDSPCTDVVKGSDAVYVACIDEIAHAYIEDRKEADPLLRSVYGRYMSAELARKEAETHNARIAAALKGGADLKTAAGELKFTVAGTKLTNKNIAMFRDIQVRDIYSMAAELGKTDVNAMLAPQRGLNGYYLVHLDAKEVPASAADQRDSTREQLLNQKKNQALNEFYLKLERESNLTDVPEFMELR